MNFTYLDKAFKKDDKAVLIYPINDYETGTILEVGTTVNVVDIMLDPSVPSGYSALINLKNAGRDYIVDKDYLMPYADFKNLYNKVLKMALMKGRL
jgi:hypothetical protein